MRTLQLTTSRRSFFDQQVDALRDRGVECTVLEVPGEYLAADPRTVSDYLRFYPQVLARAGEYDVVHANYGLLAPLALAQPTRPTVVTYWGTDLMSERAWLRALSRHTARFVDRVVLPSRRLSSYLTTDYVHIPFPVDTESFQPMSREAARDELGWQQDATIVLFPYDPARAEKDYPRARRVVEAADVDADLRVVTDEPYERMPLVLNASDAVLVTSRRESGPMIVREAAACNVPIVSTNVGFVSETVADVDQSVVCVTDDELVAGLESVLTDGGRSTGRASLDCLAPAQMAARLVDLYESALADSGGAT